MPIRNEMEYKKHHVGLKSLVEVCNSENISRRVFLFPFKSIKIFRMIKYFLSIEIK